jgi:hypothetical protein
MSSANNKENLQESSFIADLLLQLDMNVMNVRKLETNRQPQSSLCARPDLLRLTQGTRLDHSGALARACQGDGTVR